LKEGASACSEVVPVAAGLDTRNAVRSTPLPVGPVARGVGTGAPGLCAGKPISGTGKPNSVVKEQEAEASSINTATPSLAPVEPPLRAVRARLTRGRARRAFCSPFQINSASARQVSRARTTFTGECADRTDVFEEQSRAAMSALTAASVNPLSTRGRITERIMGASLAAHMSSFAGHLPLVRILV